MWVHVMSGLAAYTAWNKQSLWNLHLIFAFVSVYVHVCLCVHMAWLNTNFIIIKTEIAKYKEKIKYYSAFPSFSKDFRLE